MDTPVNSKAPVAGSTRISFTSSAPGSVGGAVKTPSTSVTKTADRAPSSLHNSTIHTSPERMATPCASSSTTSPCTTGTRPRFKRLAAPSAAPGGRRPPGNFFFSVSTKGHGEMVIPGTPASISAEITCLFSVVTERRVFAAPSSRRSDSGYLGGPSSALVPLDTAYSRACWWPKDPAPWITAMRTPSAFSLPSCCAEAPSASSFSVSNWAFFVHAEPPIFTTTSAHGGRLMAGG
mmetsp:Transcript_109219/g.315583  ORF Transcript_109219/g.315583 Transcript_109219/m.315583 type:complete len:235 (+) Transcript_109219:290-994(+)